MSKNMFENYPERHRRKLRVALVRTGGLVVAFLLLVPMGNEYALLGRISPTVFMVVVFALLAAAISWLPDTWDILVNARVHPYFEREVGGIDTFTYGRFIVRHWKKLDALATGKGVAPLSQFGFEDDMEGEPVQWHQPEDGIKSIDALLAGLKDQPELESDVPDIISDLERIKHALHRAREQGIRFCLLLRLSSGTNRLEWEKRKGTAF